MCFQRRKKSKGLFGDKMIETVATLFVILGLLGALANAKGRILLSYQIWLVSNAFFVWYNFQINSPSQILSNMAYFIFAVIGYLNYRRSK